MSFILYSYLPTEIVWKIYEDLHRSRLKDTLYELEEINNLRCQLLYPTHHLVGPCECDGFNALDEDGIETYYYCYFDAEWDRIKYTAEYFKEAISVYKKWNKQD